MHQSRLDRVNGAVAIYDEEERDSGSESGACMFPVQFSSALPRNSSAYDLCADGLCGLELDVDSVGVYNQDDDHQTNVQPDVALAHRDVFRASSQQCPSVNSMSSHTEHAPAHVPAPIEVDSRQSTLHKRALQARCLSSKQLAQHVNSGSFSSIKQIFSFGAGTDSESSSGAHGSKSNSMSVVPAVGTVGRAQQQTPQRVFLSLVFLAHKQNAHRLNENDIVLHNSHGDVQIELKTRDNGP